MKKLLLFAVWLGGVAACSKKDAAPAAGSTYLLHGTRTEFRQSPGTTYSSSVTTALRDSLVSIAQLSSDSLRLNGVLCLPNSNASSLFIGGKAANGHYFAVQASGAPTFLAVYTPGDSVQLTRIMNTGQFGGSTDFYRGKRLP